RGRVRARRQSRLARGAAAGAGLRGRHDPRGDRGAGEARVEVAAGLRNRHRPHARAQPAGRDGDRVRALDHVAPATETVIETLTESGRLLLRRPTEADVESPPGWLADPEVMDWLGGIEPPAEVVWLWLEQWKLFPTGKFLVERRSDGAVVGRVGANY